MTEDKMVGWHHRLNGHEFELQEIVKDREAWYAALSHVCLFVTPWTIQSVEFSRPGYWSG